MNTFKKRTAAQQNALEHRSKDGRFASFDRPESTQVLGATGSMRWGRTGVEVGSRTPWGSTQDVDHIAPGIDMAFTASHEGIKLSPERQKLVPPSLRERSGWYNGDDDRDVVMFVFPEEYSRETQLSADDIYEIGAQRLKDRRPEDYMKATGEKLGPSDSKVLALAAWSELNPGLSPSSGGHTSEADPEFVIARSGYDSYVVPRSEFGPGHSGEQMGPHGYPVPFMIDPERHTLVVEPEPDVAVSPQPPVVRVDVLGQIGGLDLTDSEKDAASKQLSTRYLFEDYGLASFADVIKDHGVQGVVASYQDDARAYSLVSADGGRWRMQAKTFKALAQVVPNLTKPHEEANIEERVALARWTSAKDALRSYGMRVDFKARAKEEKLHGEYRAAAEKSQRLRNEYNQSEQRRQESAMHASDAERRRERRLEAERFAVEQHVKKHGRPAT